MKKPKRPVHTVAFLAEEVFRRFLTIERKRSERSGDSWVLVHVDVCGLRGELAQLDPVTLDSLYSCLAATFRETDLIGWFQDQHAMGVIVTELGDQPPQTVRSLIEEKLNGGLEVYLPKGSADRLGLTIVHFPEAKPEDLPTEIRHQLFPDVRQADPEQDAPRLAK